MLGQTISHFQILDKLGEGGMGIVYRARDLKLDRSVALKFLPRHLSENSDEKERFIQEAKAASALDHPNICTIHEIDETDDGQLFIAMAAYEGETIKQRIRRGALPLEEVVELGIQMTAGLAAAHDRGIIHRDVKPANFMITPDGVVKILDFGLSKLTNAPSQLTQTGTLMGTAAYMSPEQVQGDLVDQQTDIWALGVVLYEMATGNKPFRGSNDLSTLYRIVHQEPDSQTDSGRLPTQLRGILRKALSKELDRRYTTMTEVQADLERLRADTESSSLPPFLRRVVDPAQNRSERMRRVQLVTAGVAVLLAVLVLGGLRWLRVSDPPLVGAAGAVSGTAWIGCQPISEDAGPDWRGVALSELLLSDLPDQEGLRWIQPSLPPRTPIRAEGAGQQGFAEGLLQRLRDTDGVRRVVGGFYGIEGGDEENPRLRVELWIQETRAGAPLQRLEISGQRDNLLELASRLAADLGRALGAQPLPTDVAGQSAAVDLPSNPAAAELLVQARERLRWLDAPAARQLAEKGLALEPQRGSLEVVLADALLLLGQEREAREHARAAVLAAKKLPQSLRVSYLASLREAEGKDKQAASLLRALEPSQEPSEVCSTEPERLDRKLRLSSLLMSIKETEAARRLLAPCIEVMPTNPRLLLAEAEVARRDDDYRRQREFAMRAARQAGAEGATLLFARARALEGEALRRLNELDAAEAALEEARAIFVRANHVRGQADVLQTLGNVYWDRQDLAAAKTLYETAARLYGTIGNDRLRNRAMNNQALVLKARGELQAALEIFKEVRVSLHAAGDFAVESIALVTMGEIAVQLGRFSEAADFLHEGLAVATESGYPVLISSALSANGEFLLLRGELVEADHQLRQALEIQDQKGDLQYAAEARSVLALVRHYQGDLAEAEQLNLEALAIFEKKGNPAAQTRARRGLGEVLRSMGRFQEARAAFEQALALQDKLGDLRASETRLSLAVWWLEDGDPAKAAAIAHDVRDEVARRGERLMVAKASTVLAEALLAQGKLAAAEVEIAAGREQLKGIESPIFSWPLELAAARLDAARGELTKARASLQSLLAAATTAGFLEQQLETRLLLAQLELEAGGTRGTRVRLEQLADEAMQKGFGRMARKAKQSLIDIHQN